MGLDMYLDANRFFFHCGNKDSDDYKLAGAIHTVLGLGEFEVNSVTVRAAYWRKANAVHAWFVANVQDDEDNCADYDVSREQLCKLRELCQSLVNAHGSLPIEEWRQLCAEKLPTQDGFFFGGTEYDDGYLSDLADTVEQIDKALQMPGGDDTLTGWTFTYHSSW